MSNAAFRVLLGLSAALVLVMLVSALLPTATQPTAQVHPEVPSLLQSTGGLAEQPETLWLGYLMGVLVLSVMAACVWIGLRKHDAATPLNRWMLAGFAGYALVFTGLTITYATFTGGSEATFFGGFPAPSAWMIYGMWFFPLLFVALFTFTFDRWVLSAEDLTRFHELVEENRKQGKVA